jgi:hypothetical protein
MAEHRGRAAAAVSMQVKPETKAAAKGHNNANVERHRQQHEIVGVEAVKSVQQGAQHAVKAVLDGGLAFVAG